jgi:hypothetical protein
MPRFIAIALYLSLLAIFPAPGRAQITLEFNRSDQSAIRYLEERGFSSVNIVDRDVLKLRAEACREGIRYRLKLRVDGRVYDQVAIGKCGRTITIGEAREIARAQGILRAVVTEQQDGFVAEGCIGPMRRRLVIALSGAIISNEEAGSCRPALSPEDITGRLQEVGYSQLRFVNRGEPPYVVEGCRRDILYRLRVSADGEIIERNDIGDCARPIDPATIGELLRKRGYDRVEVIDDQPPRFRAEACRNNRRLEVVLDIFGSAVGENEIGVCTPPLDRAAFVDLLLRQGFYRIVPAEDDGRRLRAKACYGGSELELVYSRFGELVDEKAVAKCGPMSVADLLRIAAARGLQGAQVTAEGCKGGRKIRLGLDGKGAVFERPGAERC